ncbi:MAG: YHS domain-containing protein [Planctomycetota bacterium]|jgi:YHS domain-containing protein
MKVLLLLPVLLLIVSLGLVLGGCEPADNGGVQAPAGDDEAGASKAQATCPVMGGNVDKDLYADHEGKRVYFCCPGCEDTFGKDPEKYIKKLEDKGVEIEKVPEGK